MPLPHPSSRRILIVKLSSLGDLFHALPAVHVLKQQLQAEIDWVTQPEYAALVACFTDVNRVIAFPRRRFFWGFREFMRALRAERYDWVVDLQGLFKSALTARLARGALRIGPLVRREGAGWFYSQRAGLCAGGQRARRAHAVLTGLDTVRHLGLKIGEPVFPVSFPDFRLPGAVPRIGFVPESRWPSKNWPPERFAELAVCLHQRLGGTMVLLGDRRDSVTGAALAAGLPDTAFQNLSGTLDLVQLGGVLQALDLVITNDTGPMHMAAAVGTPVVALFGPTDPGRTGPWGTHHRVLRAEVMPDCAPCFQRHCPCRSGVCLTGITVAAVLAAALQALSGVRPAAPNSCNGCTKEACTSSVFPY